MEAEEGMEGYIVMEKYNKKNNNVKINKYIKVFWINRENDIRKRREKNTLINPPGPDPFSILIHPVPLRADLVCITP